MENGNEKKQITGTEEKQDGGAQQDDAAKRSEELKKILDPEEQIIRFGRGRMALRTPIMADNRPFEELTFDFTALTGREYVDALDSDQRATNAFRVTSAQAFALFAKAAAKATDGIDEADIRERMGAMDCVKATQLAAVFFSACNRAGNRRIFDL